MRPRDQPEEEKVMAKAMPPRPGIPPEKQVTAKDKYVRDYWEKVDALFYRTIGHAEKAFNVNIYINIVIVCIGIAILA